MIDMSFRSWIALAVLLSLSCTTSVSDPNGANSSRRQQVPGWFWSEEIGANVNTRMQLPPSYDTDTYRQYPVVYLLDADWYFSGSARIGEGGISGLVSRLAAQGDTPEVILVGVCEIDENGINRRGRDFHGSPGDFFRFFESELVPHVEQNFRTLTTGAFRPTLVGHSSGGHFALYAMFQYNGSSGNPFRNFISISGNFEGEGVDTIYTEEAAFYDRMKPDLLLPLTLYMGVGGAEEERFIISHHNMREILLSRCYLGFVYGDKLYSGLDHGTIIIPAVEDGLKFIFQTGNLRILPPHPINNGLSFEPPLEAEL